jgi:two-component system response regulator DesR
VAALAAPKSGTATAGEPGAVDGEALDVLVVDDHDVVHWGLRLLLERQPWVASYQVARTAPGALELARRTRPHVALVDLLLGDDSGAELCEEIRAVSPRTRVLLISGAGRVSPAVARAAGASGFISKDWGAGDIVRAVRMVSLGMDVFEPGADTADGSPLSPRERDVISLVARGATNREIAKSLHLSPHTVKEYTSGIYRKLGVRNRAEAVKSAQTRGLIG